MSEDGNRKDVDRQQHDEYSEYDQQQYEQGGQQYEQGSRQYDQQQYDQRQGHQEPRTASVEETSVPTLDGEEVLIDARPAWSAYAWHFLAAGLVLIASLVAGDSAIIFGLIVSGAIVGYVYYLRKKVRYVVTDRRMMVLRGISSKATNEAWMVDIVGLQTGASFLERLLGHGHLTVTSQISSTGFGLFGGMTFGGIHNYEEIAQMVRERQQEAKMR